MSRIFKALERAETGRKPMPSSPPPAPDIAPPGKAAEVPVEASVPAAAAAPVPVTAPAPVMATPVSPASSPTVPVGAPASPAPARGVRAVPVITRPPEPSEPAEELEIQASGEHERLKIMLTLAAARADMKSVMLLSALSGEGVSSVALGLAGEMAAGASQGILLVEAHDGAPSLGDALHVSPRFGLADVLRKEVQRHDAIVASPVPQLYFLDRGHAAADFSQPRWVTLFEEVVNDLRSVFDYVIVDGGSLEISPDSLLLARCVEGVVLVVDARDTPQSKAREATFMLRRAGANVLGVVLNRRRQYVPGFLAKRL